jgi:hypothetical protein
VARQLVRTLAADAARAGVPLSDLLAAIEAELGAKTS